MLAGNHPSEVSTSRREQAAQNDHDHRLSIGVIGAGPLGGALARRCAALGHQVSMANSRGPATLRRTAAEMGVTARTVVETAGRSELVVVAIPTKAVPDLPSGLLARAPAGQIVVDVCNYHPELRDGRIAEIDDGMIESRWVEQQLGHPVTKAFNNIFASSLLDHGSSDRTGRRIALSVSGDQIEARSAVLRLVDELGFDTVDGGGLDQSWRQQPGTPAYCRDLDSSGLRQALDQAELHLIAAYRASEEDRIRRSMDTSTREAAPEGPANHDNRRTA